VSRFLTRLDVTPYVDGKSWVVLAPFKYEDDKLGVITVPVGFLTDFASTPWWSRPVFPSTGYHQWAAVIHDWLYWIQACSRAEADRVFLEAMRVSGTLLSKRRAMWRAVRIGGWWAWGLNARDRKAEVARIVDPNKLPAPTDLAPRRGLDRLAAIFFAKTKAAACLVLALR